MYEIQINARCEENNTPLVIAVKEGHYDAVKYLLEQKAGTEEGGQYGWTPLMWAALNGKLEIAKLLVQFGANVNACDRYNESCIHLAIRNQHTTIVEFLIESGAEPNKQGEGQMSPFLYAVSKGDYNTSKLLLQYADINEPSMVCFCVLFNTFRREQRHYMKLHKRDILN